MNNPTYEPQQRKSLGVEQKYLFVYNIQTIFVLHKRQNNIFRSK